MADELNKRIEKNIEDNRYIGTNYIHLGGLYLTEYTRLCQLIGGRVNILAWKTGDDNDILDIVVDRRDTSEEMIRTLMSFFELFFED